MNENPYQAPAVAEVEAGLQLSGAEQVRTEHLKHEASLKAVGLLYLIGGALLMISFLSLTGSAVISGEAGIQEIGITGLLLLVAVGQLFAGWGLRKLKSWARIPAAIIAGLSMLRIPIGTVIGGYILYLLFSAKGKMVLSPAYLDIVAQTPHLRYRTPRWIWILLGALLLFVAVIVVLAIWQGGD